MKKLTALFLAILLTLSLISGIAAEEKIRVGFANINERGSFGKMVRQNMIDTAQERGYELIAVDNNSDGATAVANADTLLAMNIDYMIEFNVDTSVAPVIMEKFNAADIPVVAIDIQHEGATFFGANNEYAGTLAGETAGDWINANWDGAVDYVVLIIQPVSGPAVAPRVGMFPEGLRNKGISVDDSIIVEIDGQNDAQFTQARFADFLLAHPQAKKIAVATINDVAASGVYAAAETSNRAEHVVLVSQNATADFVEPMYAAEGKTNWIASIAYFPNRYGEFVFNIIDKMVAGEPIEETYYIDHIAITWDNIKEWYPIDNLPWEGL